jgi:2-oxoglutarate dehydrogenase complex dehydrogenase (E1) component-like enzyme
MFPDCLPADLREGIPATVGSVISHLKSTYANHIGVEFMYIPDRDEREWFAAEVENVTAEDVSDDELRRYALAPCVCGEGTCRDCE